MLLRLPATGGLLIPNFISPPVLCTLWSKTISVTRPNMAYCQSLPQESAQSAYGRGACAPCLSAFDPFLGSRAQTTIATNAVRAAQMKQVVAAENAAEKKAPKKSNYLWVVIAVLVLLILGVLFKTGSF